MSEQVIEVSPEVREEVLEVLRLYCTKRDEQDFWNFKKIGWEYPFSEFLENGEKVTERIRLLLLNGKKPKFLVFGKLGKAGIPLFRTEDECSETFEWDFEEIFWMSDIVCTETADSGLRIMKDRTDDYLEGFEDESEHQERARGFLDVARCKLEWLVKHGVEPTEVLASEVPGFMMPSVEEKRC